METEIINYLKNKSILIVGYGREGRSAYNFIRQNIPDCKLAIANQTKISVENETVFWGEDYLQKCKDYDVVIKSPGVPIKDELDEQTKRKITSLTDLFLRFCKNPVIGITGTKGKSTTSSLIHHILKNCNKDSILIGNIGVPCFEAIRNIKPKTIIVFELSAHQLEFIEKAPHISILLNLYEEHLDHYLNADSYYNAKKNIYRKQNSSDYLIYGDIFQHTDKAEIENLPQQHYDMYSDLGTSRNDIKTTLVGEHNIRDIMVAIKACELMGVDKKSALKAVESFQALPHRLAFVGTFDGIKFYDDTIATAQEACMNAIKALGDVDTVIVGGMDRGLNYGPLVNFLNNNEVANILLLPETSTKIAALFPNDTTKNIIEVKDLPEAVNIAFEKTAKGKSCLLSPAAASYGVYSGFEEKGDHFCKLVQTYRR